MLDPSTLCRSRVLLALGAINLTFFIYYAALNGSTALRPYLQPHVLVPSGPLSVLQPTHSPVSTIYNPRANSSGQTRRGQRPDVAKVSMLYGENEYYVRAIATHLRHAKRHGHPAYVLRKELISGIWNKLLYLIHVMVQEMHYGDQAAKWIM